MKTTTRNMFCVIAVAPVVALLGGAPAEAGPADDGPLAALMQGQGANGSAADLARPILGPFPYFASDTVKSAGTARIESLRDGSHEATSLLGRTSSPKYDLQAQGIASKCQTPAKGRSRGTTVLENATLQGRRLPEHPAVGQRIPLRDGAYAVLNKQVRSAEAFTVIGTQFVDKTGKTTDLAKTRCVTPQRMMAAQRRVPGGDATQRQAPAQPPADARPGDPQVANGAVDGLVEGLVGGLMDMQKKLDKYMYTSAPGTTQGRTAPAAHEDPSQGSSFQGSTSPGSPLSPRQAAEAAKAAAKAIAKANSSKRRTSGAAAPAKPAHAAPAAAGAAAPDPQPKLLGGKLVGSDGDDVLAVLRGSGNSSGLKSSLFEEKESTGSGLFGGLPGLQQLPANVSDLLQGYAVG